jgi:hypothetical protein
MQPDELSLGIRRRKIEDRILSQFEKIRFDQRAQGWLEDETFWDFVFEWYALAHHYEETGDTTIGAAMLDLYAHCVGLFRAAQADETIRERRRDRATDALYQINYYMNMLVLNVRRNTQADPDDPIGRVAWTS